MSLDFDKLESPFVRENVGKNFVVTDKIAEGYDWVFSGNSNVIATEKLHGTNIGIVIRDGEIKTIWNRGEPIDFFSGTHRDIIEGMIESSQRGYCNLPDGRHFGELIGKSICGDSYNIKNIFQGGHVWLPFNTYVREHLTYSSWKIINKDFYSIAAWIKDLKSLYSTRIHGHTVNSFCEGVVFHNLDTGQMAKLRKDMYFDYKGKGHKQ